MVTQTHAAPTSVSTVGARRLPGVAARLRLTGQAAVQMIAVPVVGAVLFSVWLTLAALSPLTVVAPLLLPVTVLVRRYADGRRAAAGAVLGRPVPSPYRGSDDRSMRSRLVGVLRDRQSWRDAEWLLASAITGCVTAALTVSFFLGGLFYLAYPVLFAVTPRSVFGHPFGDLVTLHSTAQACLMMPLAIVSFGLWWALLVPLARVDARLDRRLLGPRV